MTRQRQINGICKHCRVAYEGDGIDECGPCAAGRKAAENMQKTPPARRDRVEAALRAIVAHWDEFGPLYDFDYVVECGRAALNSPKTGAALDRGKAGG